MIQAHGLAKHFGSFPAVQDVTLEVGAGEIVALLGPNGAGKTTTVRLLCSLLRPSAGWARVAGYDSVADAPEVRRRVGLLTELPGLYSRMTADDYLTFFGQLQELPVAQQRGRSEELLRYFGLWDDRRRPIGTYSKGMRQKLALARALLHDPQVVLLDEPTSAMDPASAKLVRDHIQGLRAAHRTILICTHNLAEAEALADRIAIIRRGRIVAQGSARELKRRLLGLPRFEVRFHGPVDPGVLSLDGLVRIEEQGADWVRYSSPDAAAANPLLLRQLVAAGVAVTSLGEVPQSLEEVYLRLVEEEAG